MSERCEAISTAAMGTIYATNVVVARLQATCEDMNEFDSADDSWAEAKTDWDELAAMTDEEAHANALADEDNPH